VRTGEQLCKRGFSDFRRWQSSRDIRRLESALEAFRQARSLPWRSAEARSPCLLANVAALEEHLGARPESTSADSDQLIDVLTLVLTQDMCAWTTSRGSAVSAVGIGCCATSPPDVRSPT
jgi:hypothetical protein